MKRGFLVLILAVFFVSGAFALPEFRLSAGAGGYFASDFGGGAEVCLGTLASASIKTPYVGIGGFVFLDATFVELSLGFLHAGSDHKFETTVMGETLEVLAFSMTYTGLDIGLLGKYPFKIGNIFSIYPLLGINYRIILSSIEGTSGVKNSNSGDYSALWFKAGGGLDFSITNSIFLRAGILYGIRLANKAEDGFISILKYTVEAVPGIDIYSLLGHGLEIKFGAGYRF